MGATVNLTTKVQPYVDEVFTTESKRELLTNKNYSWTGAHTIKVNKVNTVAMNDYDRAGTGENKSRYGAYGSVGNEFEEMTLKKDRSFTFVIDKLDSDETQMVLSGGTALARQQREVVIPEVDAYTYGVMCDNAGTKDAETTLTSANIYEEILVGNQALDDAEAPETGRCLVVTPASYFMLKRNKDIIMETDVTAEMRLRGVIGYLDGLTVIKVPANRLPAKFGFMIAHPVATVAPVKLEDYKIHQDPPGISGQLVEGRIAYDAFVLDNKKKAIYYAENKPAE